MNPVAFQRRFREALESLNAGDTASASNSCATLLGAAPDHPGVLQLQATILLRRNEPQAALQFARRSLASRPEHVPSLILAARAARAAGLLAPAAAFLHSATAHAPGLAEPVFLACHVFLEQNDTSLDAALADAHARFPGHASEWQVLGLALQRAGGERRP